MANIATQLHAALKKITRPGSICVSGSAAAPLPGLDTGIGPVGLPSMRPLGRLSQHPLWYSDTMSDAKALLAAAWATGDLTPLLALADLLDEQDNPDFAELLRLTIAEGQTARCDQTRFQRLLQLQEEMRERIRQHAWPDLAMESGIAMSFSRRPDPSRHEREHIVVRADRQTLHRLRSEVEGRDEVLSTQHGEELARCLLIPDRLAALQKRSDTYWAAAFTLADNFFPLSHHLGNRKAAQAEQLLRFETAVAPARIAIADLPCELVPFVAWLLADHAADKPRRVGNGEVVPGAHIFVFKNWAWRHAAALDNRDSGRAANLLRQRLRAERWRGVSAGLLVVSPTMAASP